MMMERTFGAPRIQQLDWGRLPDLVHQGHCPQSSKLHNQLPADISNGMVPVPTSGGAPPPAPFHPPACLSLQLLAQLLVPHPALWRILQRGLFKDLIIPLLLGSHTHLFLLLNTNAQAPSWPSRPCAPPHLPGWPCQVVPASGPLHWLWPPHKTLP